MPTISKVQVPPFLKKGDTIGLLCPAGFMPMKKAQTCIDVLQQWGYKVKRGNTLGRQHHYFSGTEEERLADMQQMLNDPEIKAILCARGGYGCSHLVDKLDWKKFRKHPKWISGYSDVTVFHSFLNRKLGIASIHAPMAGAFNEEEWKNEYVQSLKKVLSGKPYAYQTAAHDRNRNGKASGLLVGGNLSLVIHQLGTPSDAIRPGCLLFIEDIGEYLYNIDRMLMHLERAGKFRQISGLIVGGFSECKDTQIPFGKDIDSLIADRIKDYDFPVCFHFPVSHQKENYALITGQWHELDVGKKVTLKYKG